jgi:hypothetical protein
MNARRGAAGRCYEAATARAAGVVGIVKVPPANEMSVR